MAKPPSKNTPPDPHAVGYGRPPADTRFKAGRSGNPKGRPKGSSGLNEAIGRELLAAVTVTEDGVPRRIPKQRVIARQLVHKAAGGDLRAATVVLGAAKRLEDQGSDASAPGAAPADLPEEDQRVVQTLLARLRLCLPSAAMPDSATPDSKSTDSSSPNLGEADGASTDPDSTQEPAT